MADVAKALFKKILASKRNNLTELEARQVLESYNIPLVRASMTKTVEEALTASRKIGYPVVSKKPTRLAQYDSANRRWIKANSDKYYHVTVMVEKISSIAGFPNRLIRWYNALYVIYTRPFEN